MGPLDLSERGRGGALQREDFLFPFFSLPIPGLCYLIHNPSLNCEHRCSSQSTVCSVHCLSNQLMISLATAITSLWKKRTGDVDKLVI